MKLISKTINREILVIFLLLFLCIIIALNPAKYIQTTLTGINVWAINVLPGLLPFFFLTKLLTSFPRLSNLTRPVGTITNKLFNCPGVSGYVYFMSILSGYPLGAKLTAELYQQKLISEGVAHRMTAFCSTSGPMFIIGSIGASMLLSPIAGIIIFLSHILSTVINGLLYRKVKFIKSENQKPFEPPPSNNLLSDAMYNTITSCMLIGGFIAFSFVLIDILISFKILAPISAIFNFILSPLGLSSAGTAIASGLIEVTRGCLDIASLNLPILPATIISSALISFGGLSIHLQSLAFLSRCNIKYKYFILTKVTHAVFCALLCALLGFLFI